jgi:hypothetical protein
MTLRRILLAIAVLLTLPSVATAQTTAGSGTTIVIPVTAETGSFASEVTLFNPGSSLLTASVKFYEANNSPSPPPGLKVCNDINVSANRSVQFQIATQCALGSGDHFGLLVLADKTVPQTHVFYGYSRVQNPKGIGFSVEGFPAQDFNNQVSHATGLKKQAASPTYQTNCFVGSLDQAVSYQLKLFNGTTGAQIGGTLAGSLQPFQQFRYLDVFGSNGVKAPAGDQANVRAEFTQTSGGSANLIGFCTVQDNTSFGADFRIAKSYGSPSSSFFAQGGNAFGATARLGTIDNQPLTVLVNNRPALRIVPAIDTDFHGYNPNVIGGSQFNTVAAGVAGATIGGGGGCNSGTGGTCLSASMNQVTNDFGTIAGGLDNRAGYHSAVGGGRGNNANANGGAATVGGGALNAATGTLSTVPGGLQNVGSGDYSFAAGRRAHAVHDSSFVWGGWLGGLDATSFYPNSFQISGENGLSIDYGSRRPDGGGTSWVLIGKAFAGEAISTSTGGYLSNAGMWTSSSDRRRKTNVRAIDATSILDAVARLPISTWQHVNEDAAIRHLGPMAQDFYAAFGLGANETSIGTIDADGVALAAIQGLHQLMQQKDVRIGLLEERMQVQQRELEELRQTMKTLHMTLKESI